MPAIFLSQLVDFLSVFGLRHPAKSPNAFSRTASPKLVRKAWADRDPTVEFFIRRVTLDVWRQRGSYAGMQTLIT